ncbi:MAG: hypothetical protein KIT31_12240 [Deltaproteobacteria bacterium]|nr:hypothetical protein [Deltaproteobacteria bacterium]
MGRWQRYWFAEGGRTACAALRIAIALSVLFTLHRLATLSTVQLPGPPELYRPVGIWMLLGHAIPPDGLITLLWVLAWGGSVAMLLGLATRAATAISFVGAVSITSLSFASTATWSHQYNVVLLAQLAFLGARGGDTWSLDALIRRGRGLPPVDVARGYQWSVRLVQLAVALMFVGAVAHKLGHGKLTLRWALSDSLRHHLLVRYDLAGIERPALVDWLLEDVWRYRTAAMLNLISQATPILAVFFIRRPWVRAFAGLMFVVEVLGLGFVVSLWNQHWLPLAAAFVDWDALVAWARRIAKLPARPASPSDPPDPPGRFPSRRLRGWIVFFVAYDALTSFIPTLDQKLNTYPFTGFPMFSVVRARAPYDEHHSYEVPGDRYEVTSDLPLSPAQQRWFDHQNRRLFTVADPAELRRRLTAILETAQKRYPDRGIRGVRHYLAIYQAQAYPAPARFDVHPIAITAEIRADGSYHSMLGKLVASGAETAPEGVSADGARLVSYGDDLPSPVELAATRTEQGFVFVRPDADPLYVVAIVDGTPWLVAAKRSWRWQ